MFSVDSFHDHGKLSGRYDIDESDTISRLDNSIYKQNQRDFVLWKPSDHNLPGWKSPWGFGRPGWHIECSAMSWTYLGENFDIHGGGQDLIFPHHENEIAQSCCAFPGSDFANYWIHNGLITVSGKKMSKSFNNFVTLRDALKIVPGEALKLYLLKTHYRAPFNFTTEGLLESKRQLDKWYKAIEKR